jgi:tRNA(Ile)-lysidine synthetase-like protein
MRPIDFFSERRNGRGVPNAPKVPKVKEQGKPSKTGKPELGKGRLSELASDPYPIPGQVGGRLIREVISFYRAQQVLLPIAALPLASHILIAVSGGIDSMALAQLLVKYGRRVGGRKQIRLVHINHRWRGAESDADENFVRQFARRSGVGFTVVRLKPLHGKSATGESLEAKARNSRKKIFERLSQKYQAPVFTAHHADDLAETMIWRLLTGSAETHGGGIQFQHGPEIRPLLRTRKETLRTFLVEEKVDWREDRTNHEGRFLRSKLRQEAMPALEGLFPRMVERLVEQALQAQRAIPCSGQQPQSKIEFGVGYLFHAAGLDLRRNHLTFLKELERRVNEGDSKRGEWDLPEGWKLRWEGASKKDAERPNKRLNRPQRWILERH